MSFERWENRLFELYYGPDCDCDSEQHCDGIRPRLSDGELDEDHECCQCREPYIPDQDPHL